MKIKVPSYFLKYSEYSLFEKFILKLNINTQVKKFIFLYQ